MVYIRAPGLIIIYFIIGSLYLLTPFTSAPTFGNH